MSHHVFSMAILVVIKFDAASCELLPKPQNHCEVLDEEKTVALQCNSTLQYPLTWLSQKPGSSRQSKIFNGFRLHKNFTSNYIVLNGKPGRYELNVNATKDAAQRYICLEPGTLIKASAEVIIIESAPQCTVTRESEFTTYACQVRFYGNWAPTMIWTMGNSSEVIDESVYNISSIFIPNEIVMSRLVLPTYKSQDLGLHYACTTKFTIQEKPFDTTAENIPEYNYTWISSDYTPVHGTDKRALIVIAVLVITILTSALAVIWVVQNRRRRRNKQHNTSIKSQDPAESQKFTQGSNNSSSDCKSGSVSSCSGETGYSSIDSNNGNIINNINDYSDSGNDINV